MDRILSSIDERSALLPAQSEHISSIVRHCDSGDFSSVLLDWEQAPRSGLKVHMIGRRCSAFGTIIDDEIPGKGRGKIQHSSERVRDTLRAMIPMRDCEMAIDDWKRIAIDRVIVAKLQSLLLNGQIFST